MDRQATSQMDPSYPPDDIRLLFAEIESLCATESYVFRGEAKLFDRVETGIRRIHRSVISAGLLTADELQQMSLDSARRYTTLADDQLILSELQHFGATTNLLDFSEDYRIALFFACMAHPTEPGRLIFCNISKYPHWRPTFPSNRVIAQKSVFIQPPDGLIEPDRTIEVPYRAKGPILDYLKRTSGLSQSMLFNDLHGFIRIQKETEEDFSALRAEAAPMLTLAIKMKNAENEEDFESFQQEADRHMSAAASLTSYRAFHHFVNATKFIRADQPELAIQHLKLAAQHGINRSVVVILEAIARDQLGETDQSMQLIRKLQEDSALLSSQFVNGLIGELSQIIEQPQEKEVLGDQSEQHS